MTTRYIVQRAVTLEVLTFDAPVVRHESLSRQLSASSSVNLIIEPDVVTQLASDGRPLYETDGSIVSIEEDGQLTFRGLCRPMSYDGPTWTIPLRSMGSYPYGIPYEGVPYYGAHVDPADVIRLLWDHVQSFPDADFGVTVVGSTTVGVGTYSTRDRIEATREYRLAVQAYEHENNELQRLKRIAAASRKTAQDRQDVITARRKTLSDAKAIKPKNQAAIDDAQNSLNAAIAAKAAQDAVIDAQQKDADVQAKVVAAAKLEQDRKNSAKNAASAREQADGGAWRLFWWEAPDCGKKIDELTALAPLDWFERHYWDGEEPRTQIVVAHPRVGRRLSGSGDPTFEQGVNIAIELQPQQGTDDDVTSVLGIGAGEGAASLRRSITKRTGRVRRVKVFQAKDIHWASTLDRKLRVELARNQTAPFVDRITVYDDHPNSPRGSYSLGDDIYVQGVLPNFGRFQEWHRVLGITENADGTSDLQLARTDSFTYGKGVDA